MTGPQQVFYRLARSYTETSAGVRAMHLLCDRINRLGQPAYLVPVDRYFETSPRLLTPILTKSLRDAHSSKNLRTISIQDESINGNPLRTDLSIRWLLNHPGLLAGKKKSSVTMNFVYANEIEPGLPRLFVNTIDYLFYENHSRREERPIKLFYAGKLRSLGVSVDVPAGSIEIFRDGAKRQSRQELRELFSQASVLYLAEDSAIALEAAICGCPTVHMKELFQKPALSTEDGGVGLSSSDSPSELAKTDLSEVAMRRHIAGLELRTNKDVSEMILRVASFQPGSRKRKSKFKLSQIARNRMRLGKLRAGYKRSGITGLLGVFFAHRNRNKMRKHEQ